MKLGKKTIRKKKNPSTILYPFYNKRTGKNKQIVNRSEYTFIDENNNLEETIKRVEIRNSLKCSICGHQSQTIDFLACHIEFVHKNIIIQIKKLFWGNQS